VVLPLGTDNKLRMAEADAVTQRTRVSLSVTFFTLNVHLCLQQYAREAARRAGPPAIADVSARPANWTGGTMFQGCPPPVRACSGGDVPRPACQRLLSLSLLKVFFVFSRILDVFRPVKN